MARNKIITFSGLFLVFIAAFVCALTLAFGSMGNSGVLSAEAQETNIYATHDHSSWTELSADGGELSSGNYYLNGDITLTTNITIPSDNSVTLCLNGHTLTGTGSNSVITVNGSLILEDCSGNNSGKITSANQSSVDYGGGVNVGENATFTMESGTISGNGARRGGGVYTSGIFVMKNGLITDNNATTEAGGGVYNDGTFTMEGGTISGNKATSSEGGGVLVENGTFIIKNGEISGNSATSGGGVYVGNGTFTMQGGTISGNNATNNFGGGVYVGNGTFTMQGGTISDNTAANNFGGGVYVMNIFNMSGGEISGNNASDGGGVFIFSGCQLNMQGGTISENTATGYGGGVLSYGTLEMSGGSIISNTAEYGGGVYTQSGTIFNMSGGEISGNNATSGVDIYNCGILSINGGCLSNKIYQQSGTIIINGGNFVDMSFENYLASDRIFVEYQSTYEGYVAGYPYVVCQSSTEVPAAVIIDWKDSYEYGGATIAVNSNLGELKNFEYSKDGGQQVSGLPKDVGTYTITCELDYLDTVNKIVYNTQYSKVIQITPKKVEVHWGNTTLTYNGSAQAPTATATGINGEEIKIVVSGAQTEIGKYTATATTENVNYELINATKQFSIIKEGTVMTVKEGLTLGGSLIAGVAAVLVVYGMGMVVGKIIALGMKKKQ